MEQDLKKLGLTDNEIKVYLSLVKIGETAVGGIINDLKIHRQIAYNALDGLEKQGLVIKILKNDVFHFKVADPEILIENLQKQELIAQRISKKIQAEMKKSRREQEINVYDGIAGIRRFFMEKFKQSQTGSIVYVLGGYIEKYIKALGQDFYNNEYTKIKARKQNISKLLISEKLRHEAENYSREAGKLREIKYLPDYMFNPIALDIWGDGVSFMSLEKSLFVIEVKNKEFRESYLKHFNSLWEIAKP